MPDATLIFEKLEQIDEALNRITRRFSGIRSPDDFLDSPEGLDKLDGICMKKLSIFAETTSNHLNTQCSI